MTDQLPVLSHLQNVANPFVPRQAGSFIQPTPIPRLRVWSSTHATPPTPSMFEPMFYAVLRGTKVLNIGGSRFELNAGDCASSSFGLPYVGQVVNATRAAPYVAIGLDLDVELLTDVMLDMPKVENRWVCSAAESRLEGTVGDAFLRLVQLLATPEC